ncbi:MAG: hypothetical protein ACXV3B_09315, partial [Ilumatobacteraceae bacterium]
MGHRPEVPVEGGNRQDCRVARRQHPREEMAVSGQLLLAASGRFRWPPREDLPVEHVTDVPCTGKRTRQQRWPRLCAEVADQFGSGVEGRLKPGVDGDPGD